MFRWVYIGILLVVFLCVGLQKLQASVKCSELFSYVDKGVYRYLDTDLKSPRKYSVESFILEILFNGKYHHLLVTNSKYNTLSKITSSYDRFTKGRDTSKSNSHIVIDEYRGSSGLRPYPVVKVELQIKDSSDADKTQEKSALINSSTSMLMVLDNSIKRSSIKGASYQGEPLKISKVKSLEDKTIYLLTSKKELEVVDDYAQQQNNSESRKLQDFLLLYDIPQNLSGMLEVLFPPVQSVVAIRDYGAYHLINGRFDRNDTNTLKQLAYVAFEKLVGETQSEDIHSYYQYNKMFRKNISYLVSVLRNQSSDPIWFWVKDLENSNPRWFWVKDLENSSDSIKRKEAEFQDTSTKWEEFMKLFVDVLNSESLKDIRQKVLKDVIKSKSSYGSIDWSYPWEDFVSGVDDKIDEMGELLDDGTILTRQYYKLSILHMRMNPYVRDNLKFDYDIQSIFHDGLPSNVDYLSDDKKKVVEEFRSNWKRELRLVLKKIACLTAIYLNVGALNDRSLDLNSLDTHILLQGGGCTGTIVSSNTIITAAHCLEKILRNGGTIKTTANGSKGLYKNARIDRATYNAEAVAYYINPKFFRVRKTTMHDIAIVRFPDDTFKDIFPSKVNPRGKFESGVMVGTQGSPNRRKLIMMDLINKEDFSEDYFDHPEKKSSLYYNYGSYEKSLPGDSGSSLFNEDDEIVGILHGGNTFAPIAANMDFIRKVIRMDPKVEIRGINKDF